jgi:hypothetical protein
MGLSSEERELLNSNLAVIEVRRLTGC